MILIPCDWSPFHKVQYQFHSLLFKLVMCQSSFLGQCTHLVQNTNGAWLASAIAVEKLNEFGNTVQPWWPHGQSWNTCIRHKWDAAKDIDMDVDDNNFVSSSSSDVGEIRNEEVRKPSTQTISEIYWFKFFSSLQICFHWKPYLKSTWKARAACLSQRPSYWQQLHQRKR